MKIIRKAIKSGFIKLGNIELKCHILDDGERVIDKESMELFMSAMADGTIFANMTDAEAQESTNACAEFLHNGFLE